MDAERGSSAAPLAVCARSRRRSRTTQLVTLAVAFVLVVGIVAGSAWWLNTPTYALLFSDMDAESAAQIVTRLKTLKVPYQLDEGGRAIRVPSRARRRAAPRAPVAGDARARAASASRSSTARRSAPPSSSSR